MEGASVVRSVAEPLYRAKGWMKLAGVLAIIQGAFAIFTGWGILVCWIPIWMGIVLCSASNHVRIAFETDSDMEFRISLEKLGTYFRVFGVLALVMLIVFVVGIFVAIAIPSIVRARQMGM